MHDFEIAAPESKHELLALLATADEDTRIIAGGTGLLTLIKQRLASPERLVSLHRVSDLSGVSVTQDTIAIGALERLLDLQYHPEVCKRLPVLQAALAEIASPRIRSMATLGGAVAHGDPNQDLPPALLALDAVVLIESQHAASEVPIVAFYRDYYETALQPGQLVTGLRIPIPKSSSRFAHRKFTPGSREDYACVGVCVRLDLDGDGSVQDSRIVLGSVGPTVFRASAAEACVAGQSITPELAAEAGALASEATDPVDDARGSAEYKRRMSAVWVKRCLLQAAGTN